MICVKDWYKGYEYLYKLNICCKFWDDDEEGEIFWFGGFCGYIDIVYYCDGYCYNEYYDYYF